MASSHPVVLSLLTVTFLLFSAAHSVQSALQPPTFTSANPGGKHTCALAEDGSAFSWGSNQNGQLGIGTSGGSRPTPQAVVGGLKFARLSAGGNHTCGMTEQGDVFCWGLNMLGQLGNKTQTSSPQPVKVATNLKFTAISAGFTHTCGVAQGGDVHCWGDGRMGQLGIGSSGGLIASPSVSPVQGHKFVEVHAGGEFTCGRTQELAVLCWGSNGSAQLGRPVSDTCKQGDREVPCSRTPVVVERTEFRLLSVGLSQACATRAQGDTICWGSFKVAPGTLPKVVPGGKTFAMIAVGSAFACGLENGDIHCWGSNFSGQLGNGTKQNSIEPTPISGTLKFGSVHAGDNHACGLTTSRHMSCWGRNLDGQLGNGTSTDSPLPVAVQ